MKMHGQTTLKRVIFVVTAMRISHIAIKLFIIFPPELILFLRLYCCGDFIVVVIIFRIFISIAPWRKE